MPLFLCFAFMLLFVYATVMWNPIVMVISAGIALYWAHQTKDYWENI